MRQVMNPNIDVFLTALPQINRDFLVDHIDSLEARYFEQFPFSEQLDHIKALSLLTPKHPVEVMWKYLPDKKISCTILSYNYDGIFSFITGALSATGFNISSGDGFTTMTLKKRDSHFLKKRGVFLKDMIKRRFIIDHFEGELMGTVSFSKWSQQLKEILETLFVALEKKDESAIVRHKQALNITLAEHIQALGPSELNPLLLPMSIRHDSSFKKRTRFIIQGQDTPYFLFSLVLALSHFNVSLEYIKIRTDGESVNDTIELTKRDGQPIHDPLLIDQIIFSIIITKQFAAFISHAPNPNKAIHRFSEVITRLAHEKNDASLKKLLVSPNALKDLARLLGASDFIWEDIVQRQYESLYPVLQRSTAKQSYDATKTALNQDLKNATSFDEKKRILNLFKDKETFQADLDHILRRGSLLRFSERLNEIAEIVIQTIVPIIYKECVIKFGKPRTAAGLLAEFAVFGLGKFGGRALGYASDIELIVIYSDSGKTDNNRSNAEFFEAFVVLLENSIESKKDGIFELDFRLRPYGKNGPKAVSLDSFCRYYGHDGESHFYERLSLVRLRGIAGNISLRKQIERLRESFVYEAPTLDVSELWTLRKKQFQSKTVTSALNAKFSPGTLVDLEYAVQALQVLHGCNYTSLRTPLIESALQALSDIGVVKKTEQRKLIQAYLFFRNVINGLRMLRGNAKDLEMPKEKATEHTHLARRIGYHGENAGNKLTLDFEKNSAVVRTFVEKHFKEHALHTVGRGTVMDLLLNPDLEKKQVDSILASKGFKDTHQAFTILKRLGKAFPDGKMMMLLFLSIDYMSQFSSPDSALINFEDFLLSQSKKGLDSIVLLEQPKSLEMVVSILSSSQFLSDTLIQNPHYFDWFCSLDQIVNTKRRIDYYSDIFEELHPEKTRNDWYGTLRNIRRREILRIALRDIMMETSLRSITSELSYLAETLIQCSLIYACRGVTKDYTDRLCIIGFGKLGGTELNYSSDIDLIAVFDTRSLSKEKVIESSRIIKKCIKQCLNTLSDYTKDGFVYRVDVNLRPFGRTGDLMSSLEALIEYYKKDASAWEIQALIKARPVAGNWYLGFECLQQARVVSKKRFSQKEYIRYSESSRREARKKVQKKAITGIDIKNGKGGIRDIEFLVQLYQLISRDNEAIIPRSTLDALIWLGNKDVIDRATIRTLRDNYLFFRRVEHALQLNHDRQTHALPKSVEDLNVLAKRVLGHNKTSNDVITHIEKSMAHISQIYDERWKKE